MEITASTTPSNRQRTGCLVVAVYESRRLGASARALDEASDGLLTRLLRGSAMRGRVGQTVLLHHVPGPVTEQVLLVGCGKRGALDGVGYRRAVGAAMDALGKHGVRTATVYLGELEVLDKDTYWRLRQCAELAMDASYRFDAPRARKRADDRHATERVVIGAPDRATLRIAREAIAHGVAVGRGVALARDLGNLPGNHCTPTQLAEHARKLARAHDSLKVSVRGEPEMKRLGMGSLLAVSSGSRQPARLITIEYAGGPKGHKPIALVGKGVTFDSGGISIKPSGAMDEMKFDMCGAASVIGTLSAVAEIGLARNVIGIIPATENLPGGEAVKPGDVVTTMSEQTVEILNTDAEGRLILCDALTFAARFEPEAVVDIATLTGACVVALGSQATGLFANDDALADALLAAGESTGDRAWRMPLWDEYNEQLKSNFADLANIGGREAGAVTAACFLGHFARDMRWAHLDIAGTAWRSGKLKGATGRPVRLLCQFLLDGRSASSRRATGPG